MVRRVDASSAEHGEVRVGSEALVARVELGDQHVDALPADSDGRGALAELGRVDRQHHFAGDGGERPLDLCLLQRRLECPGHQVDGCCREEQAVNDDLRGGAARQRSDEAASPHVEATTGQQRLDAGESLQGRERVRSVRHDREGAGPVEGVRYAQFSASIVTGRPIANLRVPPTPKP